MTASEPVRVTLHPPFHLLVPNRDYTFTWSFGSTVEDLCARLGEVAPELRPFLPGGRYAGHLVVIRGGRRLVLADRVEPGDHLRFLAPAFGG